MRDKAGIKTKAENSFIQLKISSSGLAQAAATTSPKSLKSFNNVYLCIINNNRRIHQRNRSTVLVVPIDNSIWH